MYGNPLSEFLRFIVDFFVFAARSIYFLLETFILTITPNRYRKLKVSVKWKPRICDTLFPRVPINSILTKRNQRLQTPFEFEY